jgi:hypothetical protein
MMVPRTRVWASGVGKWSGQVDRNIHRHSDSFTIAIVSTMLALGSVIAIRSVPADNSHLRRSRPM